MVTSSTSPRGAHHSTHAYLASFRSIQFKLSNNRAQLSKQSLTADTAIRIVLLTLQGCTTTHTRISYRLGVGPFKRVPARMLPRHFVHSSVLVQRVAYLRGIRMRVPSRS